MEIYGVMQLSTACISVNTAGKLNEVALGTESALSDVVVYAKGLYGWFIPIPENMHEITTLPQDLRDCMLCAKERDCKWLMFDRDLEYDDADRLPKYDW